MVDSHFMRLAFFSTYPPRACGIATFTQDLVRELDKLPEIQSPRIFAISNGKYTYSKRVMDEIDQQDRKSYPRAAERLNRSGINLLVIEHEYGIFGGADGEYLLDFIAHLQIPFLVTLHTVLSSPSDSQKRILHVLGTKAQGIITMSHGSIPILRDIYQIDPSKITVIHHGVPLRQRIPRYTLKKEFQMEGRPVVSTFGLLSPGKGLEYGIRAIAEVAKRHPDILYLVLGKTHPVIRAQFGEQYRNLLEQLVSELHILENVWFVNKYLEKDEIIRYLQLSDVYMTPYLGKEQAVSGTLAYAVGYGRVIVSTPYPYAKEMLADGRGLLADFQDAASLAKQICYVLEHPDEKKQMEGRTLKFGTQMLWVNVANEYATLFKQVLEKETSGRHAV